MTKKILTLAVALFTMLGLSAVAYAQEAQSNIVELAQSSEDLSTLVTAVVEADLVDALSDEDASLTVFAPTNAAFEALPEGTLDQLLSEEGKEDLVNILTYHVVDSAVLSSELSDGQMITTLNGDQLEVSIEGENVFISGAQVVSADLQASNGVVHVIDSVLIPVESSEDHSMADTGIATSVGFLWVAALGLLSVGSLGGYALSYLREEK